MKKLIVIVLCSFMIASCDVMECEKVQSSEVTFLIDISDPRLFEEASDDIKSNLSRFMSKLGLNSMGECFLIWPYLIWEVSPGLPKYIICYNWCDSKGLCHEGGEKDKT